MLLPVDLGLIAIDLLSGCKASDLVVANAGTATCDVQTSIPKVPLGPQLSQYRVAVLIDSHLSPPRSNSMARDHSHSCFSAIDAPASIPLRELVSPMVLDSRYSFDFPPSTLLDQSRGSSLKTNRVPSISCSSTSVPMDRCDPWVSKSSPNVTSGVTTPHYQVHGDPIIVICGPLELPDVTMNSMSVGVSTPPSRIHSAYQSEPPLGRSGTTEPIASLRRSRMASHLATSASDVRSCGTLDPFTDANSGVAMTHYCSPSSSRKESSDSWVLGCWIAALNKSCVNFLNSSIISAVDTTSIKESTLAANRALPVSTSPPHSSYQEEVLHPTILPISVVSCHCSWVKSLAALASDGRSLRDSKPALNMNAAPPVFRCTPSDQRQQSTLVALPSNLDHRGHGAESLTVRMSAQGSMSHSSPPSRESSPDSGATSRCAELALNSVTKSCATDVMGYLPPGGLGLSLPSARTQLTVSRRCHPPPSGTMTGLPLSASHSSALSNAQVSNTRSLSSREDVASPDLMTTQPVPPRCSRLDPLTISAVNPPYPTNRKGLPDPALGTCCIALSSCFNAEESLANCAVKTLLTRPLGLIASADFQVPTTCSSSSSQVKSLGSCVTTGRDEAVPGSFTGYPVINTFDDLSYGNLMSSPCTKIHVGVAPTSVCPGNNAPGLDVTTMWATLVPRPPSDTTAAGSLDARFSRPQKLSIPEPSRVPANRIDSIPTSCPWSSYPRASLDHIATTRRSAYIQSDIMGATDLRHPGVLHVSNVTTRDLSACSQPSYLEEPPDGGMASPHSLPQLNPPLDSSVTGNVDARPHRASVPSMNVQSCIAQSLSSSTDPYGLVGINFGCYLGSKLLPIGKIEGSCTRPRPFSESHDHDKAPHRRLQNVKSHSCIVPSHISCTMLLVTAAMDAVLSWGLDSSGNVNTKVWSAGSTNLNVAFHVPSSHNGSFHLHDPPDASVVARHIDLSPCSHLGSLTYGVVVTVPLPASILAATMTVRVSTTRSKPSLHMKLLGFRINSRCNVQTCLASLAAMPVGSARDRGSDLPSRTDIRSSPVLVNHRATSLLVMGDMEAIKVAIASSQPSILQKPPNSHPSTPDVLSHRSNLIFGSVVNSHMESTSLQGLSLSPSMTIHTDIGCLRSLYQGEVPDCYTITMCLVPFTRPFCVNAPTTRGVPSSNWVQSPSKLAQSPSTVQPMASMIMTPTMGVLASSTGYPASSFCLYGSPIVSSYTLYGYTLFTK
ncbi:hypothetical protein JAAARDRAFT_51782 [Jaapia argillacea MUCL 33604]|uniref:Uncharacterized protein n=1 Tax=Jaapia argillacea MUCL 33604 TaxID=933084 RepID=A0A067PEF5_9AGAM|nr:hypothetical protein JAAARDRAFT_51782 [Jaapia argillacea MUCL 33604]